MTTPCNETKILNPLQQFLQEHYRDRQLWRFRRHEPIPLNSEDLWIVEQGFVQLLTIHYSGEVSIIGLAGPSMPFGLPFTTINPYQAIPLSDVVLMRLHHMEIEQSPRLAQALMPAMIRRFQQTETLLAIAHCRNIKDRLRQLIPFLKQELGLNNQNESESQVKLTKQQLAHMIGATRPTVSKFLGELSQEGIEL